MSVTFTKLFASITESTVWCEPDTTRLAWITMLAMADSKGRVWGSIPGLANRARISVDSARTAISTFMSPDPDSRTSTNEGRRIEIIDGGWRLLNHEKYRSIRDKESIKESKRKYINTRREKERTSVDNVDTEISTVDLSRDIAEAEAEADKELTTLSGKAPTQPPETPKQKPSEAEEALEYLNEKSGSHFKPVKANVSLITARIRDGASLADIKRVIDHKVSEWKTDAKMSVYLRPSTLFNATKYAQYAGQLAPVDRGKGEWFELLGKFETELTPQEKTQVFVARSAAK